MKTLHTSKKLFFWQGKWSLNIRTEHVVNSGSNNSEKVLSLDGWCDNQGYSAKYVF